MAFIIERSKENLEGIQRISEGLNLTKNKRFTPEGAANYNLLGIF